jgi:hypothetical protein
MDMKPVKSSNIKAIGYDPAKGRLQVEFLHGGVYQYEGVPQEAYDGLLKAKSIGSHFFKHIRSAFKTDGRLP